MTDYEIANMALDKLGSRSITSFTDANNPHSAMIGRFLPFYRREILMMKDWPAAMKQAVLAEIGDSAWTALTAYLAGAYVTNSNRLYVCITAGTSAASGGPTTAVSDITDGTAHWRFCQEIETNITEWAYRYPVPADCLRIKSVDNGEDYERIGRLIYTNSEDPTLRYVWDMTDSELWDNLMVDALSLRLAAALAPTITGKPRQDLMEEMAALMMGAYGKQAMEGNGKPTPQTLWIDEV